MSLELGLVAKRYRIGKRVGKGAFGDIFAGVDLSTGQEVAIKIERKGIKRLQLMHEAKVYKCLQGGLGIPKLYWAGEEADHKIMVTQLLGPSLEDLFYACKNQFSLATTVALAEQLVSLIEYFHNSGFLHRDIKPDNFVVELDPKPTKIYIIDYGLAKLYKDQKTKVHIALREGKKLTGTARYASIYTHQGLEQSRRDDLECLGYVLIYLAKGHLPWQGIRGGANKEERYEKVMERKKTISIESLCKNLPIEFVQFMHYSRAIKFEDRPDYMRLKKLFTKLFKKRRMDRDFEYDWNRAIPDVRKVSYTYRLFDESDKNESKGPQVSDKRKPPLEQRKGGEEEHPKRKGTTQSLGIELRFQPTMKSVEPKRDVVKEVYEKKLTINPRSQNTLNFDLKKKQEDSCNFNFEDILEDCSLLDETIPNEKVIPMTIKLPVCSYINNTRHFIKNRMRKDGKSFFRAAKTFVSLHPPKEKFRRSETRKSYGLMFDRTSSKNNTFE